MSSTLSTRVMGIGEAGVSGLVDFRLPSEASEKCSSSDDSSEESANYDWRYIACRLT